MMVHKFNVLKFQSWGTCGMGSWVKYVISALQVADFFRRWDEHVLFLGGLPSNKGQCAIIVTFKQSIALFEAQHRQRWSESETCGALALRKFQNMFFR